MTPSPVRPHLFTLRTAHQPNGVTVTVCNRAIAPVLSRLPFVISVDCLLLGLGWAGWWWVVPCVAFSVCVFSLGPFWRTRSGYGRRPRVGRTRSTRASAAIRHAWITHSRERWAKLADAAGFAKWFPKSKASKPSTIAKHSSL